MAHKSDRENKKSMTSKLENQEILNVLKSASSPEEIRTLLKRRGWPMGKSINPSSSKANGIGFSDSNNKSDPPEGTHEPSNREKVSKILSDAMADKIRGKVSEVKDAANSKMQTIDVASTVSEEVQEIMGYIPNWITRWGITVFALFVLTLLIGSWFIQYPDVIPAQIIITTNDPPKFLRANVSGKLSHLLVENNQAVRSGQYLAVIENTANYQFIFDLKPKLKDLQLLLSDNVPSLNELHFSRSHQLGELQTDYESLLSSLQDYKRFTDSKYVQNKIVSVRNRRKSTSQYIEEISKQEKLLDQELVLTRQSHERTVKLFNNGLVSQSELEQSQAALLQKESSRKGASTSKIQAEIQLALLDESIMDLEYDKSQKLDNLVTQLRSAAEKLQSGILKFEKTYVLISPTDGLVSITNYWSENQNVSAGEDVLAVIPEVKTRIVGKIELPLEGSGKVHNGQSVNVKLANYPFEEFGMVRGKLESISLIPTEDSYILTVVFPVGLVTSYGKTLKFYQEMQGSAEIITADIRLFHRMLSLTRLLMD